ncbi:hypothetical protein L1049_010732 [Liquidambar formosana]|uniref:Brf1 TBP-binding domain-containing protein n=1 Tax=Liquidambar formosana TaxID=63359 RepID=A0AAP0R4T5_LIQFO
MRDSGSFKKFHTDKGASAGCQDVNEDSFGQSHRRGSRRTIIDDVSESLSDIDDREVITYLHSEKEMHYKRMIWEVMNRDFQKIRKQKRAKEAKKTIPAKKAAKITSQIEKKRLSSKINYDVLKRLIDEPVEIPERAKGDGADFDSGNCGNAQSSDFSVEAHNFEKSNYGDECEHENGPSEEIDASSVYYDNSYYGNKEDGYSYDDDYDYEQY